MEVVNRAFVLKQLKTELEDAADLAELAGLVEASDTLRDILAEITKLLDSETS